MKIAVFGTGDVGKTLASAFHTLGHEVMMGSRSAANEKAVAWAKPLGARASTGTYAEAAAFGELLVLCTLGIANQEVLRAAGAGNLEGKVLIDTTNPLDFSGGIPPKLAVSGNDSGGEQVQRAAPGARVVKAFNTVGHALMFRPELPGGPPDMPICGNDEAAKKTVTELLRRDFGWNVLDVGGIEASRYLEAFCVLWVIVGVRTGNWTHALKLLRK